MLPQPSTAYLDAMREGIERRAAAARAKVQRLKEGESYPGQQQAWRHITQVGEALRGDLRNLAFDLHDHPEEAFEEHYAAATIAGLLRARGHEVEVGVGGLDTALRAEIASPGFDPRCDPTVAILAEYDALPGIGHGCGHNIIAASGVGAFLAASQSISAVRGRIVLLGTPAEEGHTGKEYLIRGGAFAGVDAAMMVHPFSFDLAEHAWVGRRTLTATFHGVAAHASSEPFMGRNALDAATLAYQGFGLLRQQMPPSDRLHAIITEGGQRPSVIPDTATMTIYVRSLMAQTLSDLSQRIDAVLDGAALMAGVEVSKEWDEHPASLPVRNNHVLSARWAATQAERGRRALPGGVVPDTLAASTDFGNVSHLLPGIHPMVKIAPQGVALHTRAFAEYARSEAAVDTAVDSAIGLAQVALDTLGDPDLLRAAREEFEEAGGVLRVE
ncbi:M20 family metallopeptidase [Corynebacterium sp. 22KM0430]|uniref:M20 family metallopeptidase n=1 Tax=Corynebacterium sp. 22KM0430 TaxID=2989735 RepID=UPI0029CA1EE0|nr:M20 family metallopeptidase [Corynebacterium sp. 22KM0430]WPF66203.1 M20 family metallopeptidase [Corynebacterium sp. 22KM0430]